MTSKIEFYQEVLKDDPHSRVFFPLAKLLAEQGDAEEAVTVLKGAIGFHPGHLEARFLLVELQTRLGRVEEARDSFQGLSSLLSNYPSVWTLWASSASGLSPDASLALRFLALSLSGKDVSWMGVLEKGLAVSAGSAMPVEDDVPLAEPADDFSLRGADEVMALTRQIEALGDLPPTDRLPDDCGSESQAAVKTRTMADLLARHGDYTSALEIYAELKRLASTPQDEKALSARMAEIEAEMAAGPAASRQSSSKQLQPAQQQKSKAKLVSMLEALANRLDARATA